MSREQNRSDGSGPAHTHRKSPFAKAAGYPALVFLFLLVLLFCPGCVAPAPADAPGSGIRSSSPDGNPEFFLYQNVVNATGSFQTVPGDFGSGKEAARAAAIRDAIDPGNPVTRDFAVSLIPRSHGGPFNLAQACDLWEEVYGKWTYVDDPRGDEYFSPASRTIALGLKGDCDDFAITLAAMMEAVGGSARVVTAQNSTTGHAYPELYIGNNSAKFEEAAAYIRQRYHVTDVGCHITTGDDGSTYWLNMDWWSRHPGGRFYADDGERVNYYPNGRWERAVSPVPA
ncbi:transglutaminase-like domain-containing protein [Methanoregula sp.]|uniref:transglutaminase-like domain-containing protein n=1 Tax=Methanoregula sp. TaxID=2052170 RepID=UPI000CB13808|nr:transglutaminase-like domain-containing protein [Methanoregula sp.]PKG33159.1 MAG: hypothetical protein CW742_04390 [Methanoregula sp.]